MLAKYLFSLSWFNISNLFKIESNIVIFFLILKWIYIKANFTRFVCMNENFPWQRINQSKKTNKTFKSSLIKLIYLKYTYKLYILYITVWLF